MSAILNLSFKNYKLTSRCKLVYQFLLNTTRQWNHCTTPTAAKQRESQLIEFSSMCCFCFFIQFIVFLVWSLFLDRFSVFSDWLVIAQCPLTSALRKVSGTNNFYQSYTKKLWQSVSWSLIFFCKYLTLVCWKQVDLQCQGFCSQYMLELRLCSFDKQQIEDISEEDRDWWQERKFVVTCTTW